VIEGVVHKENESFEQRHRERYGRCNAKGPRNVIPSI